MGSTSFSETAPGGRGRCLPSQMSQRSRQRVGVNPDVWNVAQIWSGYDGGTTHGGAGTSTVKSQSSQKRRMRTSQSPMKQQEKAATSSANNQQQFQSYTNIPKSHYVTGGPMSDNSQNRKSKSNSPNKSAMS